MHSQIMKHLDKHNICQMHNMDLQKRRLCDIQLALQDLSEPLDSSEQIDVTLLGLSKVFDNVQHELLAVTMVSMGKRWSE